LQSAYRQGFSGKPSLQSPRAEKEVIQQIERAVRWFSASLFFTLGRGLAANDRPRLADKNN
jgi:hypothetical protein